MVYGAVGVVSSEESDPDVTVQQCRADCRIERILPCRCAGRWACTPASHATCRCAEGDRPKIPSPKDLDRRATSLESIVRTSTCRSAEAGHDLGKCVRPELIERVGLCGAPLQGRLIYSNSRVHGNRTLGVVSCSLTTLIGYLIKHATTTDIDAWDCFLAGS